MLLFIDTETTGTFRFNHPPPRLVEVAWLVCEESGEVVERGTGSFARMILPFRQAPPGSTG